MPVRQGKIKPGLPGNMQHERYKEKNLPEESKK
jgi:hypothetical protein